VSLNIDWIAVDCTNPAQLATFWAAALGYDVDVDEDDGSDPDDVLLLPRDGSKRRVLLQRTPDVKRAKNRLHLDLRPDDQAAEVERLLELGATRVDIGQSDVSWVVMADPEGNEFCVLRPLTSDDTQFVRGRWGD
jgi:hypothetical protein